MENLDTLIEQAKAELENLSDEDKLQLASGYDNRGLDCISQRWYLPDEMRENSAIWKLGRVILEIDSLLEDVYLSQEENLF